MIKPDDLRNRVDDVLMRLLAGQLRDLSNDWIADDAGMESASRLARMLAQYRIAQELKRIADALERGAGAVEVKVERAVVPFAPEDDEP